MMKKAVKTMKRDFLTSCPGQMQGFLADLWLAESKREALPDLWKIWSVTQGKPSSVTAV